MPDESLKRYNELYNLCWKMLKRALTDMTTTNDVVRFGNDLRAEGQYIYEHYRDLNRDNVFNIVNSTLAMVYDAYDALPRPETDPQQMSIFDREVAG